MVTAGNGRWLGACRDKLLCPSLKVALLLVSLVAHGEALVWMASVSDPQAPRVSAQRTIQVSMVERKAEPEPKPAPKSEPEPKPEPKPEPEPEPEPTREAEQAPEETETTATGDPEPVTSQPLFEAEYLNNRPPDYPRASLRLGEEGNVALRVRVGADGNPQAVELASSSGSTRLDRAALQAVKRWRFEPARRGGSAIAAWVVVPITFKLES